MSRYGKGARSERELIAAFSDLGFSVIRAAGSGNGFSPDILALRSDCSFAFECKAWKKKRIAIDHGRFEALKKWMENTGVKTMIAWKIPRMGWRFFELEEMEKNPKSYSITLSKALEVGRTIDHLFKKEASK